MGTASLADVSLSLIMLLNYLTIKKLQMLYYSFEKVPSDMPFLFTHLRLNLFCHTKLYGFKSNFYFNENASC